MVNSKFFNSEKSSKRTFLTALFLIFASIISSFVLPFSSAFAAEYKEGERACGIIKYVSDSDQALNIHDVENDTGAKTYKTIELCAQVTKDGKIKQKVEIEDNINDGKPIITDYRAVSNGNEFQIRIQDGKGMDTIVHYKLNETKLADLTTEINSKLPSSTKDNDGNGWNKDANPTITQPGEDTDRYADEPNADDGTKDASDCVKVATLGWIICPIIEGLNDAVISMYDGAIEPFLNFNTEILASDGSNDGGVFTAWQIFQNFANIALIIIILVIIFSQLTGIGIDNYGIKKMLPKLIVAIVLINLSYIICQLAVDISNILGFSLRSLFENLIDLSASSTGNGDGVTIASGTAVAATIAAASAAIFSGGWVTLVALIPAILGGLITAAVAIMFIFILLGARQAGIILFVAIAPLAFVCYILPNTKNLFDKWLKIFKALLLVYPIAGVLMGAGAFASNLLLNVNPNDFWFGLVAMLIQVVPFFFIPTILKNSFSALGNIGNKISGFGSRMGGRLSGGARRLSSGAINNNERVKAAREEAARGRRRRYAESVIASGTSDELSRARAQDILNAQTAERVKARAGVIPIDEEALLAQEESRRNAEKLNAEIAKMKDDTDNYDVDKMSSSLSRYLSGGALARGSAEEIRAKALMKKMATKGSYGQKELAKVVANASSENRKFAAGMMSKDDDISSAVSSKDGFTAQYLRDVNAGREMIDESGTRVNTGNMSLEQWRNASRINSDGTTTKNDEHVVNKVMSKDVDFASQSSSVVTSAISAKNKDGANLISNERLMAMAQNEQIRRSADHEVVEALDAEIKKRNLNIDNSIQPVQTSSSSDSTVLQVRQSSVPEVQVRTASQPTQASISTSSPKSPSLPTDNKNSQQESPLTSSNRRIILPGDKEYDETKDQYKI